MKNFVRKLLNKSGYDIVRLKNSNNKLSDHLINVFMKYGVDCVIDVGANSGQYGKFLRQLGYKGWIISYEPVPAVFNQLEECCKNDEKWDCYSLAIGDVNTEKEINIYGSTDFSSFFQANNYAKNIWSRLNLKETKNVSVVRLDSVFDAHIAKLGIRNCYLKLDTQGYDQMAFLGAYGCMENIVALQTELSLIHIYDGMPDTYEMLKILNQNEYFISGMYPINRDESLAVIEYDCVLVKKPYRTSVLKKSGAKI